MNACLCFFVFFVFGVALASDTPFQLFQKLDIYPFVRLLSEEQKVGTSTSFNGDSLSLAPARTSDELTEFLRSPPSHGHFVLALNSSLFTSETISAIENVKNVRGIAILSSFDKNVPAFSPVMTYPQQAQGLHPTSSHIWNPLGSGIRFKSFRTSMVALNPTDSQTVLDAAVSNARNQYKYPRQALLIDSFMHAPKDSSTCLRRELCQPIGGQSVWGMFGPVPPPASARYVMLSAAADADSMFYRLANGANSATSAAVAVLAAAKAIAQVSEVHASDTRVVVALFGAEAFGHLGSRRFSLDITNFKCKQGSAVQGTGEGKQCDDPSVPDTAFAWMSSDKLAGVVEASMVGGHAAALSPWYVHSENSSASADLAAHVVSVGTALNKEVKKATPNILPPSVAEVFVRANPALPAVVVSEFDSTFAERYYQSRLDVSVNVSRICEAASLLAHATVSLVAPNATVPDIDCAWVEVVVQCFTADLGCALLQNYSFPADYNDTTWTDDRRRANLYTSVFRADSVVPNPLVSFAEMLLAQYTSPPSLQKTCSRNSDCGNRGRCINKQCANGTAHFHRAISPAFDYTGSGPFSINKDFPNDTTWTESNWQSLELRMHLQEDVSQELGFFFLGLFLTVISAVVLHLGPRHYKRLLYGIH